MGIPSLLNLLKSIVTKKHIKEYKDQTIAVDVYTWLHPAIYTCSYELANNIETTKHIDFCVKKVDQILSYGIKKVVLVFDGRELPSKKGTEEKREKSREESKLEAQKLLEEGKKEAAYKKFASSIDVTPQMAYEFIYAVKGRSNIECIVAPYEADAQLAYLSKIGYVDVVLSEDSDLLAFGCKKVLFKLYKGDQKEIGDEICLDNIKNCKEINMSLWDQNMFLTACIFAGCDYLPSLKKMGINTAFKMIGEHKSYKKCLLSIQQKNYEIPSDYDEKFQLAFLTFRFQFVYCPLKNKIVHLNSFDTTALKLQYVDKDFHNQTSQINWKDFEENVLITPLIYKILSKNIDWSFLGDMDEVTALKVSLCQIDPQTLQPYNEVKSKLFGLESSSSMPVRMGNGGLSSLQNKNKFEFKGRQHPSASDSLLNNKQSSISSFLKVGVSKNNLSKTSSHGETKKNERSLFLMEDANSNSINFNRSKSNEKSQETQEGLSLSQQAFDMFSKNIFNKNSSLVKPFKPPSTCNSQNAQPNSSQVSKQKGDLKRPYNQDYFESSEDENNLKDEYLKGNQIVESQLEDANSSRKDNTCDGFSNFQYQKDENKNNNTSRSQMDIENKNVYEEGDLNEDDNYTDLQQLNQFKKNSTIQKNIESNLLRQKTGLQSLSGISSTKQQDKQEDQLSNKLLKKLKIDKTPINEIKQKNNFSLLKQNLEIRQIKKIENINDEDEEYTSNNEDNTFQKQKEKGNYQQSQAFIKKVAFDQVNSQDDDEKSCFSTQSQKILTDIGTQGNDKQQQSQKLTQKTASNESSVSKQEMQKEEDENPSMGSSAVASTVASDEKKEISRLSNFSKEVDGKIVIDSQFLFKQHPEFNFLEKFSMYFKNEIDI